MAADPKPAPRVTDPAAMPVDCSMLTEVERAVGVCPCCSRRRRLTRHHLVGRGQGGDDLPVNLVWVCGDGTRGCHGVLTHRNRDGETYRTYAEVGRRLLASLHPTVRAYAENVKWEGWLEETYAP